MLCVLYTTIPAKKHFKIVLKESSRLGLPGRHENIVQLDADHNGVCRFDIKTSEEDEDNYNKVRANVEDLYEKALRKSELIVALSREAAQETKEVEHNDLEARFAQLSPPQGALWALNTIS